MHCIIINVYYSVNDFVLDKVILWLCYFVVLIIQVAYLNIGISYAELNIGLQPSKK